MKKFYLKRISFPLICCVLCMLLSSCNASEEPTFVIGVSQCSQDIWRDKLNRELQVGAYFHEGVELRFASADDSDERQVEQIDRFVAEGIDLLIVAPNQVATVTPAIDRAFDKGIPVIVFDRKTNSQKYTAYIGADNREMGRMMGEYIAAQLKGRGRVLEVMGLKGSSPAIERHEGFCEVLQRYPDIELVASLQGDWTEQSAVEAINKYEGTLSDIDYVFGQNDRMAMGARQVLKQPEQGHDTRFCGIDGLPGHDAGIEQVLDAKLDASCIYPTHGDEVLQLAIDILEGKPYKKDNSLKTALVTHDNANVLLLQSEETERQATYLDRLHLKADGYLRQLATQHTILLLAAGIIGLLVLAIVLFYLYHRGKVRQQRQRVVSTLWNMEAPEVAVAAEEPAAAAVPQPSPAADTDAAADAPDGEKKEEAEEPQQQATGESVADSLFIARFKEVVEKRLHDSELSVELLAADMNLSRVQLYRKVKAISGSSPVELVRTARLNRGYQLLLTTGKSISEVAYAVGFSAPSYFTKCFKEEFGKSPSDLQR